MRTPSGFDRVHGLLGSAGQVLQARLGARTKHCPLQYGQCDAEFAVSRSGFGAGVHRFDLNCFNDFDAVAAPTSALDLVVSAPTAVSVHAAALGIEGPQRTYGTGWQTHCTAERLGYRTMARYPRS